MSVESAFYTYLSGVSAVSSLVGDRIYPGVAPAGADLPMITQQRISQRRYPNFAASGGMVRTRQQLDVYAATQGAVDTIVEALRDALDGWRHATMSTEQVFSVQIENVRFGYESPSDGSDIGVHSAGVDFVLMHRESVPTF